MMAETTPKSPQRHSLVSWIIAGLVILLATSCTVWVLSQPEYWAGVEYQQKRLEETGRWR